MRFIHAIASFQGAALHFSNECHHLKIPCQSRPYATIIAKYDTRRAILHVMRQLSRYFDAARHITFRRHSGSAYRLPSPMP